MNAIHVTNVQPMPGTSQASAVGSSIPETIDDQPPVMLTLGGRQLALSYRAFAFIAYAKAFNADLLADLQKLRENGPRMLQLSASGEYGVAQLFEILCRIVYAGALEYQPGVTIDELQRAIGFRDLAHISETFTRAIYSTLPLPDPNADPNAAPTENPTTGANSGFAPGQGSTNEQG